MTASRFLELVKLVDSAGYADEIDWAVNIPKRKVNGPKDFACEAIWIILNSGMREQIARIIQKRIYDAVSEGRPVLLAFNHPGKAAIIQRLFDDPNPYYNKWYMSNDKLAALREIPFIGPITVWHLAKNLGMDVCKPDRHMVRIAGQSNETPEQLCTRLSEETGWNIAAIDTVIWRAANLKIL